MFAFETSLSQTLQASCTSLSVQCGLQTNTLHYEVYEDLIKNLCRRILKFKPLTLIHLLMNKS